MSKEKIVGLAVRLFAVFLVVYTLRYAPSVISFAKTEPPDYLFSALVVLIGSIPILIAFFLWRLPLTVASKLIPYVETNGKQKPLNETEIQIVAFSILGLWLLASALPDTSYWATFVYLTKSGEFRQIELTPSNIAGLVSTAFELILGLWLLLGSKGIVGVIRRLRHAGN